MSSLCAIERPAPASAAPACWQRLIADWTDGRIDGSYPVSCYGQALSHADQDLLNYSTLPDDLHRALLSATGGSVPPGQIGEQSGRKYRGAVRDQQRLLPVAEDIHHRDDDPALRTSADGWQASSVVGSSTSGLPLPLIVLVTAGLLLVFTGAGGTLTRRLRRAPPPRLRAGR
ncbi:MAG: hypothetical protein ACXVY8_04945 [Gaiellaceae bacterium]